MTKEELKNHYCDNINCNHNNTEGLCCLFNPDNCKYRQLQKENAENESEARELNIRIDGLIKENAELKSLKDVADLIRLNNSHIVAMAQLNNNNVALRKENAELKKELKDANKKVVHLACNQNKDLKRKINKAKEIIKNLMVFTEMDDREYEKEYKEAEQFLKEE